MIIRTEWYGMEKDDVLEELDVDSTEGLSSKKVESQREKFGSNSLTEAKQEPFWKAFLRQYKDYMRIVLLIAAVASFLIGDYSTGLVLFSITLINAFFGLRSEKQAEESVAALKKMMNMKARVRRDGEVIEIEMEEIVPGDIVLFEAGDQVPADGRLLVAASLEIEESALTGESTSSSKSTDAIQEKDIPLGDRVNMAYMNSNVTRGRGEMVVTGTGMDTEVGQIATMIQEAEVEKSPLQKQVDSLTIVIAGMAAVALIAIIIIGLSYDFPLSDLYTLGIALAIAAIPTALPVVVTAILGYGTHKMAEKKAVVKYLPAVETLGSTSAICSDKTGTLTLNQMTAKSLVIAGHRYNITGEGYSTEGSIQHIGGKGDVNLDPYLMPMALCSDAVIKDSNIVGDPTEGALVVLAEKGGLMVDATRKEHPRIAEVPFDSEYKYMATFHRVLDDNGKEVVRCFVKGAPDVLLRKSKRIKIETGEDVEIDPEIKRKTEEANEALGEEGMRVLVAAYKDFDPETFDPSANLRPQVNDLTLLAMIGIVDPPRPEAKKAIAKCINAGIRVRMITGDHAVTAHAIAKQLGIKGDAITGKEFQEMSDEQVIKRLDDIGVVARVSPEDKIRLVSLLQQTDKIVAMTGDGVNDAPALKKADIGVAMGITGTDVSKESAVMILTDDNFATIVKAVEYGRVLYDNLLKYIRFQMAGLFSFIFSFLASAAFGVTLTLFNPLQILFVNYFVQGSIGASFAMDTPTKGLMNMKPRKASERIMTWTLAIRLIIIGLAVAFFTVGSYEWSLNMTSSQEAAQTMAMVTFSLITIPISLNLRHPYTSVFRRDTFSNKLLLLAYGWIIFLLFIVTKVGLFQEIFKTVSLDEKHWEIAIVAALLFLLVGEGYKFVYNLFFKANPGK